MNTVLAFAGSNSATSINYQLVKYSVSLLTNQKCRVLNMANYDFPMYSEDYEKNHGFLNSLVELKNDIQKVNGLIISVNEHNSYPSAYFKNTMDWLSRVDTNFLDGKNIFLMATSPGARGAMGALEAAENMLTRFGGEVVATFSLPSYYDNFNSENGITNEELAKTHKIKLASFMDSIS